MVPSLAGTAKFEGCSAEQCSLHNTAFALRASHGGRLHPMICRATRLVSNTTLSGESELWHTFAHGVTELKNGASRNGRAGPLAEV